MTALRYFTILPEIEGNGHSLNIRAYVTAYYEANKVKPPRFFSMAEVENITPSPNIDALYMPISLEAWFRIVVWIEKNYFISVKTSNRVRVYMEANHVQQAYGHYKCFPFLGSPVGDKAFVNKWVRDSWGIDLTDLLLPPAETPTAAPLHTA